MRTKINTIHDTTKDETVTATLAERVFQNTGAGKTNLSINKFVVLMILMVTAITLMTGCASAVSEKYTQLIDESQVFIDQEQYALALEKVNEAIAIDEKQPEAYVQKGFIHVATGEYNQAGEAFSFVREHLSDFADEDSKFAALLNLGNYDYMLGDNEAALSYFMEAKKIYESDTTLLNAIGLIYISLEQYDKAKEYYIQVIDIDQKSFYAYANLATIYLREEDYDTALSQINTALSLNPLVPQFYFIKADIYVAQKDITSGIKTYSEAIQQWSDLGDAYYQRGNLYLQEKDYLNAVSDFSFSKEAGITQSNLGMGYAYSGLSQFNDAIDAFLAYKNSIDGVDLKVLYELGVAYYQNEDYAAAITSIDELLALEPRDTEAMLLKAYCLEQQQRYDDAYQILESIVAIDENHELAKKEMAFIDDNKLR